MLANWITLSRFPLLLAAVLLLYHGTTAARLFGVVVLFVGLLLDTVDGAVARRTRRTSLFGSILDIAADRSYELVLWVCFADLGLIPVAIPLIIVARATLVDALRSIGVREGTAPFAQHRTALGRFLVASSWMRTGYSVAKVLTFCGLALAQALSSAAGLLGLLQAMAWVTVGISVLRGLPVLAHGVRSAWAAPPSVGETRA